MKKFVVLFFMSIFLLNLFVSPVLAASTKKTMDVSYNDIQIIVNGMRIIPRDINGTIVEPFIYNGTTYLPVRAVSEALGKTVEWDGTTYTVYVGDKPVLNQQPQTQPQPQTLPPTEPLTQPPTQLPTEDQPPTQTQPPTNPPAQSSEETRNTVFTGAHSTIVYVSDASDTIHSISNCGNMKKFREMTLAEAREITDTYCKRCALHLMDVE